MAQFAGRTGASKRRPGISRGFKCLLAILNHVRTKNRSRPNTLTLFDIIPPNPTRASSRLSICVEPSSSSHQDQVSIHSLGPSQPVRKRPSMADRIVQVRLESIYEEAEICGGYVFAAALQDVWHAQDIEAH
ncbi:hypothetical protein FRC12_005171, partial [Ceratobasidium sp. 428]